MGGSGGGSNGGDVSLYSFDLSTATTGVNAPGLVVQSIGSGGGYYSASNLATTGGINASFSLGSTTGAGAGGSVAAVLGAGSVATPISTEGANAPGVVVQSIGGGGGIALLSATATSASGAVSGQLGQTGGNGGSDAVTLSGRTIIRTSGQQSPGVVAQSITNGGGMAAVASTVGNLFGGTVHLGSTGGDDNATGPVAINLLGGSITTTGAQSPGLVAQDIAGGGGLSLVRSTGVTLGGRTASSPYTSNTQASVTVTNGATINTSGAGSIGIVAQSIAGGGGLAYAATGSSVLGGAPSGTNGQAVLVNSSAPITTTGINAFGILAQSVGGGGGAVITNGAASDATFGNGVGNAGAVTVNVNAAIQTSGAGAHGVVAQSVAGGGGLVTNGTTTVMRGGTRGSSGLVKVNLRANVSATGAGAVAVKTMSSTDPIVDIASGVSVVGGVGGAALEFEGPTNELHNSGEVSTVDGAAGMAVRTLGGDTLVKNAGTMRGNFALAQGGVNLLHNLESGTILAGASIDLAGGLLQNDGLLKSAGEMHSTTVIAGSLTQSRTGSMELRVDHARATVDAFEVSGTATMEGTLKPTLVNSGLIAPGTARLGPFLRAANGADVSRLAVGRTAIMSFAFSQQGGTVDLTSTADFSPQGLGTDGQRIGAMIGGAQSRGLPNFQALTARLVEVPTVDRLAQAYWNISGAAASTVTLVGTQMTTAFTRTLLQRSGEVASSRSAIVADPVTGEWTDRRNNSWAQVYGDNRKTTLDSGSTGAELSARSQGLAVGHDRRVTPDTTVGFAFGTAVANFDLTRAFSGRDNALQLGAYATREFGPAYASAAASYSTHRLKTTRALELIEASYGANFDARSLATRAEAGYRLQAPSLDLTPYAALQLQNMTSPAYDEQANGRSAPHLALNYDRRSTSTVRTELGASLGQYFALDGGKAVTVRASAAWAHDRSVGSNVDASFQTLQGGSFRVAGILQTADLALVSLRAELKLATGLTFGFDTFGEFGHRTRTLTGQLSMRYQW